MNGLLTEGLVAMLIGMGTVIMFLCLTIVAMYGMSFVVGKLNKLFPEVVAQAAGVKKAVTSTNEDENIAVAIIAALLKK